MSGIMRVPNCSMPMTKSSNVSMTPRTPGTSDKLPTDQGVLVGSYANVARMLDELSMKQCAWFASSAFAWSTRSPHE